MRISDGISKDELKARALACWNLMSEGEKDGMRFGLTPLWVIQKDLGGKVSGGVFEPLSGDEGKVVVLSLMEIAEKTGGMIA